MLLRYCNCLALFLVAVISSCEPVDAQCTDETDCSARCTPEVWRKQLCVFYAELRDWRLTALRCGFDIPEINWDQSQSASVQWQAARSHWLSLRQLWTDTVLEDDITAEGSASGMFGFLDDDVDDVMGGGEGVTGNVVEVWLKEQSDWSDEYQSWKSLIGDTESEGVEPPIDPRDLWSENLSNWAGDFSTYNATHYELCTL